jgi:hypothetical protein
MISDEVLMLEFQRGSREAFEEIFARYREPLYGFFDADWPAKTGLKTWPKRLSWR